jgi:TolB-like protein/Flp pilus assembly protein TadD
LKGQTIKTHPRVSNARVVQANISDNPLTGNRSIAVLPLKFFGAANDAETDDKFLSIGLADALIARLSNVKRFVLRPTSSVLRYSESSVDSFTAGEELGVEFVVDGHIQKSGDMIRVSIQLLNIAGRTTVWAERFTEKSVDVLELEDAISNRVAESLIPRLTGEERERLEKRGTNNPQAYEAYLRGRYFYNKFTGEDLVKAVESFREAIRLDPNYAMPHVGIADFFAWSAIFGEIPTGKAFPQAASAARRALQIDSELGEAYAILAFTTFLHDWDRNEALRLVRRAMELSPNYGFAHECYANILASAGQFDEAIVEVRRAEELDPLSPRPVLMTAWTLYQTRHFDEAVAKARQANAMEKDFPQGLLHLGNNLTATGNVEEAARVLEESYRLWNGSGLPGYMFCHALVAAGRPDEARKILNELHASAATRYVKPYFLGMAHAALDETDKAFEYFEKAVLERSEWMIWFGTDMKLDHLRDDPRYYDLLRRAQNPLAQIKNLEIEKPETGGEKSIAVLPFKLFGTLTGSDDEYLGIGLADALVTKLSNVRRFVVRPTSSVLPFNETGANPFEAGQELGVDFVVDGNIRRVGERIRISVQLLDVGGNSSRWADKFDELFTDVLELEDAISKRVAESLIPRLSVDERENLAKRGTEDAGAFEAYMRGRFHWNQFTPEALPKALASFQKAIEIDPNYALAYVGLSDFYVWANIYGIIPSGKATPLAEAAARRAIELNPEQSEAYATLGLVKQNQRQWDESTRLYKKSLELLPNYIHAHEWYAATLVGTGDFEAGVKEIKLAERLDPLSLRTKTLTGWTLYQAGRYEETLERGRQIIDLDKNYPQGYSQIGIGLLMTRRAEEALVNFQKFDRMISGSPLAKYQLCFALVAAHRTDEARTILEEIKTLAVNGYVKPYFLGMAHAALGELDAAFDYFEQAHAENDPWMLWLGTDPMLESLRDDDRYFDLLRRMNNPIVEQQIKSKSPMTAGDKSIAVLPLKILGANTLNDDEYLSVGLADALITRLSNVRRFVVRPTSSVLQFADERTDSFAAGKKLGVDFVVDGNIRRVGERIRVSVQLLDVSGNSSRWADKFDEHFTDVLELEDSISERVAKSLLPQLTGDEEKQLSKRGTNNSEAYEAYLRGRFNWNLHTEKVLNAPSVFTNAPSNSIRLTRSLMRRLPNTIFSSEFTALFLSPKGQRQH